MLHVMLLMPRDGERTSLGALEISIFMMLFHYVGF